MIETKPLLRKAKENNSSLKISSPLMKDSISYAKLGSEASKYSQMLYPSASNVKMKRIAEKLGELTNKCPN